ncbi:M1 family metallopeptidase [Acidicapsa ligni]|uniref:M1 family metallopeptidase n=1 Tax=Acidicapsa ligni TaxID=542300 RepID=UPI0021E06DE0|nr:M1 family metallopeptidase [Acidicapsa ligni]
MPNLFSRTSHAVQLTVLLTFFFVANHEASAQRLPQNVKPEHYALALAPNLTDATFTGKEVIDVVVAKPAKEITLNSAEIKFGAVTAIVGGKVLTAQVSEDVDKQQATLHFAEQVPAGKVKLAISYTGILNNELRGFYLSKTAKRNYAVTQFESTDARRAFPSFDEPAFKATFDVTLIVDKGDTAISNTNIVKDEPAQETDKHAITFATTPRMSSYLLAFLVGDFQCLSGSSDGVPIRVCATPDQVQYGKFALSATEYVLHYYDTYFGIKYPMPKLDMIALPDFEAGAMENFGAITYRETDLLLDSDHASVSAQKNVGMVVAHEMAHQWFGDMVTMQWWDNIWLNEGFASWMENKPLEAWKPEWHISQGVVRGNQGTLDLDAQRITRTIRAKADTPDEINEMFDGISYGKASAMLLMVENYLGEETFRKGVHNYLSAHMYGNATAEDFWSAQTAISHKPIDKIMDSLVSQPGVPFLTFEPQQGSSVNVAQTRFFLNANSKSDKPEVWTLPVCFKSSDNANCEILSRDRQALIPPSAPFFFANAEGKGYYRTAYPEEAYRALVQHVESDLKPEERISVLGDEWALARSGKANVGSFLDLVSAVRGDSNADVIGSASADLTSIYNRIAGSTEDRDQFSTWSRNQFTDAYKKLGGPQADDAPDTRELRADLLTLVADLGRDPEAIAQAKSIASSSIADEASVDPTLAHAALSIAARNGDATFFDLLLRQSRTAANPQLKSSAQHALALFSDPAQEKRALDYFVSSEVRNQDAMLLISIELQSPATQDFAWQYVQDHWTEVSRQFTTSAGAYLVGATGSFCSENRLQQVTSFFDTHKVAASQHALTRAKNQINDCIELRAAQEPNLKSWLTKSGLAK